MATQETIEMLKCHGIKPSAQRISIMEYLLNHRTHPTVDAIYGDLVETMPTLSKTTIYNTLKLLEAHDAVTELTIDKKTAHYDSVTTPHSHFLCKSCGRIFDVPFVYVCDHAMGDAYVVDEVEINYKGHCRECLAAAGSRRQTEKNINH